jgi:hypothetical protein
MVSEQLNSMLPPLQRPPSLLVTAIGVTPR